MRAGGTGEAGALLHAEHPAERVVHGGDRVDGADGPRPAEPVKSIEVRALRGDRDRRKVEAVRCGQELDPRVAERVGGRDVAGPGQRAQHHIECLVAAVRQQDVGRRGVNAAAEQVGGHDRPVTLTPTRQANNRAFCARHLLPNDISSRKHKHIVQHGTTSRLACRPVTLDYPQSDRQHPQRLEYPGARAGWPGRSGRSCCAPQKPHKPATRRPIPTGTPRTERHTPVHL